MRVDGVWIHAPQIHDVVGSFREIEGGYDAIGVVMNGFALAAKDELLACVTEGWSKDVGEGLKKVFGCVGLFAGRVARAVIVLVGQGVVQDKPFHLSKFG